MTPTGWVVMLTSLGLVWALAGWCFYRVLTQRRWAPSGPGELSSSLRPRCSRPAGCYKHALKTG